MKEGNSINNINMNEKGLSTLYQEKNKGERDVRKERKKIVFVVFFSRFYHAHFIVFTRFS